MLISPHDTHTRGHTHTLAQPPISTYYLHLYIQSCSVCLFVSTFLGVYGLLNNTCNHRTLPMNLWMRVTTCDHGHKYRSAGGFCLLDAPEDKRRMYLAFFLSLLGCFTEKTMCLGLLREKKTSLLLFLICSSNSMSLSLFFYLTVSVSLPYWRQLF